MYDVIVVGAGSAGCVLAGRLTEDAGAKVLLLEAGGPDDDQRITIPAAFSQLFRTTYDWSYSTTPQAHLDGRRLEWPRGRVVGGSSSINAMLYVRGNPLDYDTWRDVHGCTGWGYADLLPYFRKAEDNARGPSDYHGVGGPLRVEDQRSPHPLTRAFLRAAIAEGLPLNDDVNGPEQDGVGLYQVTQRRGRRWSAASAYLRPTPPGLDLVTGALVTRVLFNHVQAVGVEYVREGQSHHVYADEIVLAGGAVNSPQLLMLSGVGPAEHLREHGIGVVADLPGVGANLQDHLAAGAIWRTTGTSDLYDHENALRLAQWQLFGRGPLTSPVAEGAAFVRTRAGLPAPDLQLHVAPVGFVDNARGEPRYRGFTIGATLVSVAARGSLRLAGPDPRWAPLIDPAYLSERADLDTLLAGVQLAQRIAAKSPLREMLAEEVLPGGEAEDEGAVAAAVRQFAQTLYHPVGTCAMGAGRDAVVDPSCRVRGLDGLRVVDASVMPTVPRGNTNAPTIAVAERAADLIRGREPLASEPGRTATVITLADVAAARAAASSP
ncbi:MAG TPA: GMC family oxidoreductase N-terminal domain-containing protein [Actinomycetes bacterium]|nr:GMC family oxidoreductase N-terminal domain-containing protein [Actinomycetes bacterium]